jgi:hypothetical protein
MDAAAFAFLLSTGASILDETRALCEDSAGLKARSLQLVCTLTALHGDIASGMRCRKMQVRRRHSARLYSLFDMPSFDAMRAANRLVDEFGRGARLVAVERALGCRWGGDHDGAANWNATFDAVMDIQNETWSVNSKQCDSRTDHGPGPGVC